MSIGGLVACVVVGGILSVLIPKMAEDALWCSLFSMGAVWIIHAIGYQSGLSDAKAEQAKREQGETKEP